VTLTLHSPRMSLTLPYIACEGGTSITVDQTEMT